MERTSKQPIFRHLQTSSTIKDVGQIEVDDVVANYEIRVIAQHQLLEIFKQHSFIIRLLDFHSRNGRASLQHENDSVLVLLLSR